MDGTKWSLPPRGSLGGDRKNSVSLLGKKAVKIIIYNTQIIETK